MTQEVALVIPEHHSFRRLQAVSLLLEEAALAYGLDTLRVGTRGFMAGAKPAYADVGFQDTISLETSKAAVRVANDRLMRKSALEVAGIRVPPSRRFGHREVDEDDAVHYAAKFRRGVFVKPRLVETGRFRRVALTDSDAVRESFGDWRERSGNRATFIVERRMFGSEYAFYVVGEDVVSIARVGRGSRFEEIYRRGPDGFGVANSDVLSLAIEAFRALPRMPHGEVRIICPGAHLDAERCTVVSVTPEIGLLQSSQPAAWSEHLAERMVAHAMRNDDLKMSDRSALLTAEFTMNEVADPDTLVEGVSRWFTKFGVKGTVKAGDREVSGTLTGTARLMTTFSELSQAGRFSKSRPQSTSLSRSR